MDKKLSKYFSEMGKRGGSACTPKQTEARLRSAEIMNRKKAEKKKNETAK